MRGKSALKRCAADGSQRDWDRMGLNPHPFTSLARIAERLF
jgi:hypothetical protein